MKLSCKTRWNVEHYGPHGESDPRRHYFIGTIRLRLPSSALSDSVFRQLLPELYNIQVPIIIGVSINQ